MRRGSFMFTSGALAHAATMRNSAGAAAARKRDFTRRPPPNTIFGATPRAVVKIQLRHHHDPEGARCSADGTSLRGLLVHRTGMALQKIVSLASSHLSNNAVGRGTGAADFDCCSINALNGAMSRNTFTLICTYRGTRPNFELATAVLKTPPPVIVFFAPGGITTRCGIELSAGTSDRKSVV